MIERWEDVKTNGIYIIAWKPRLSNQPSSNRHYLTNIEPSKHFHSFSWWIRKKILCFVKGYSVSSLRPILLLIKRRYITVETVSHLPKFFIGRWIAIICETSTSCSTLTKEHVLLLKFSVVMEAGGGGKDKLS